LERRGRDETETWSDGIETRPRRSRPRLQPYFNVTKEDCKAYVTRNCRTHKQLIIDTFQNRSPKRKLQPAVFQASNRLSLLYTASMWCTNESMQLVKVQHNKSRTCKKMTDKSTTRLERLSMIHLYRNH